MRGIEGDCEDDVLFSIVELLLQRALRGHCHMTQVTFSATFHVTDVVQNPLVVTPASGAFDLVVGTPADGIGVAQVTGGVAPYSFKLDPNSSPAPDGVSFADDGQGNMSLLGTPTTAGDFGPVDVIITDSVGAQARMRTRAKVIR